MKFAICQECKQLVIITKDEPLEPELVKMGFVRTGKYWHDLCFRIMVHRKGWDRYED